MNSNPLIPIIEQLEQTRGKISIIRDKYMIDKTWAKDHDIRWEFFNQLYRLIISFDIGILNYNENLDFSKVQKWFKMTNTKDIYDTNQAFFTFIKNGFVYSYFGILESYFRNIHKHISESNQTSNGSFFGIREDIFDELSLDKTTDWWKALSIISNIRNSIHNNGIYTGTSEKTKNITIIYKGKQHAFIENKPHNSADVQTIIDVVNDNVNLIDFINNSKIVDDIEFIPDPSSIWKLES